MTDDKQAKIDRICKWMGWRVHPRNTAHWVKGNDPTPVTWTCGVDSFDPFTNPLYCERVMEEVRNQHGPAKGDLPLVSARPR